MVNPYESPQTEPEKKQGKLVVVTYLLIFLAGLFLSALMDILLEMLLGHSGNLVLACLATLVTFAIISTTLQASLRGS